MYGAERRRKITAPDLRARKGGERIAMVTAYDYTMARLAEAGGIDAVLVGDSLGMVVQGRETTLPVTLEEICYHGRAVANGLETTHLIGDLPFMTYQISSAQALESAGKLMKEGAFESVKLEGGLEFADHVYRMVRAGIPVLGHVGLLPQSVHAVGGFKVQGRTEDSADKILADARALEQAGVYAIVIEAVPPDLAARITQEVSVPTIGIGAGNGCDGQILVSSDLLGMALGKTPKFAKRFAELGNAAVEAFGKYVSEVRDGSFPSADHAYKPNAPRPSEPSPIALDAPLALDHWH